MWQDTIVLHDSQYVDRLEANEGQGLPSFDAVQFRELHLHASHHPDPLRPIKAGL